MDRLVIASLGLALVQGCIIVDDTEGGGTATCPTRDDGACFGVTAACPADAVTFTVFTQPTNATGAFMDPFDCGTAGVVIVDPGTYDLRVEATDVDGEVIFGAEPILAQEVEDLANVFLDFEFPTGAGFFWLNWTINDAGGAEITCEDAGAVSLEVESTFSDSGDVSKDVLPCIYGGWQTRALEVGAYDVVVSLLDESENAIGATEPIPAELTADSEVVDLPAVTFMLE